MGRVVEHREFIPVAEVPAEIPEGIAVKYYTREFGEFKEITLDRVKRIMKNLRSGRWEDLCFYHEADEEGDFLELVSGDGLYVLSYGEELGQIWWTTYDPKYLDTFEETDIQHPDGQSIVFREFTTADKEAVMTAIEYFIRAGRLWDGIPWMKRWQEWVEE